MKFFLGKVRPKGWGKRGAPKGNRRAAGRVCRGAFSRRHERHEDVAPVAATAPSGDYLFANCVVLAAAVFAERWAKSWAEDLLPAARMLDARRVGK